MSIAERYLAYADAFEETFEDDDWSRIEQYFTEGAIYDGEPEAVGREAVLAKLKANIDGFDRNMDGRDLHFSEPRTEGNQVAADFTVTFKLAGCPDLLIKGTETATFDGDRIALLHDEMAPGIQEGLDAWLTENASKLSAA